jgi:hypothetical protein
MRGRAVASRLPASGFRLPTRGARIALAVAVAACASEPRVERPHKPKPLVAVLGLESADDATRAAAVTGELRTLAGGANSKFRLSPRTETLTDMKQLASCPRDASSCMADIGSFLDVDYLIYGKLDHGVLSLDLLDVTKRFNRRAAHVTVSDPAAAAHAAMTQLGVEP